MPIDKKVHFAFVKMNWKKEIHFRNMKQILILVISMMCNNSFAQDYFMLVGTYDSTDSLGVHVLRFTANTAETRFVSNFKISNPSFITVSPDEKFIYVVSETASKDGSGGHVSAFAFNKQNGMLTLLNRQRSGGDHPCHIEIDKTGRWLFVSNYTGGSISVLPVDESGKMGVPETYKQAGSSIHPQRQKSSHVHGAFISPKNDQLLVTDLGTDKVLLYDFNAANGKLTPSKQSYISAVPGSGPRTLAFHPNKKKVFVMEELTGTITTYRYKNYRLKFENRISTNPKNDSSFPGSAHLAFSTDGKFLYSSNRADQNSIHAFAVEKELRHLQTRSSLGKGPRHFSIDPTGTWLVCGNQNTNEIIVFNRDAQTGLITEPKTRILLGKPVCIKWINTK